MLQSQLPYGHEAQFQMGRRYREWKEKDPLLENDKRKARGEKM
jgi:hypothetical protein